jgi:type II secretory pathway component PulJ
MGAARFLPALQRAGAAADQQQSLDNELWQRVYTWRNICSVRAIAPGSAWDNRC